MDYRVELKHVATTPLLVLQLRATQPQLSTVVPHACGVVWDFVRRSGIDSAGRHVAVYLNANIDLEVGVEVGADAAGGGDVFRSATPAGLVATTAHIGSYARLGEAHDAVLQWCTDHQHPLAGPSWEVYGHWNEDPAQLRTDVFYLLNARP
ncbi:MAG: GyrI-like domain-containing protein [Ardenticatenales bacterium]